MGQRNRGSGTAACCPLSMRRFFPAIIALGTLSAFSNSLSGVFVFDDRLHILENVQIRSLQPIWGPLLHTSRPLVQWTLALNYAISGLAPWSYHIFNALIHVAAALTLFGIARHALRRGSSLCTAADELAMVISLLWAVHPLQTESDTSTRGIDDGAFLFGRDLLRGQIDK